MGGTITIETVREYLEATRQLYRQAGITPPPGSAYDSREHFVLAHGCDYDVKPKPKGTRFGPMGNCYGNAASFVIRDSAWRERDRYRYVEGFAMSDFFPMEHAWVLDLEDDRVFDLTWRPWYRDRDPVTGKRVPRTCEPMYFGVVFPTDVMSDIILTKGTYGCLDHYPLYKDVWRWGAGPDPKYPLVGGVGYS